MSDLPSRLRALGLPAAGAELDDFVALGDQETMGPAELLEHVVDLEEKDRARRSLERRITRSHLGSSRPMADFDWNWPTKIDRPLVESAALTRLPRRRTQRRARRARGLGKTMIAQNIAHAAILAGHSVLFITAAQLLLDLGAQESSRALDRRLKHYAKVGLLVLDEIGYLAFDNRNADLLFQVVSRRYEKKSLVLTTNLAFVDWHYHLPQRDVRHRAHRTRRPPRRRREDRGRQLPAPRVRARRLHPPHQR